MAKTTNNEKVNHFVNNLTQYIMLWEKSFVNLYWKVSKVKNTKEFKEFCIDQYDNWKRAVKTLEKFFKS